MSSSRPEVHVQIASATTPVLFVQQVAVALGLPSNASNSQILARASALLTLAQGVAAGTAGQADAIALLGA